MSAKDIVLRPISAQEANALIRRVHYSGKVVQNSQVHIGVYYQGRLEGAMQFGPSLDKRKLIGLVEGTLWNEFIELNRLAFTDALPRNSESRAIGISMRMLRKHAPQLKWVVSFADATQCGDGTIYRASGFVLTGVKRSTDDLWELPPSLHHLSKGEPVVHRMTIQCKTSAISHWVLAKYRTHNIPLAQLCADNGGRLQAGYQLRYLYFLDPTARERLTVPILPFSAIEAAGARMYRGERITGERGETDNAPQTNAESGGASPTRSLLAPQPVTTG